MNSSHFWNPPKIQGSPGDPLDFSPDVQSATECTGLMPHVPLNDAEAKSLSSLYALPRAKISSPG